ncbi:hypothetical protein RFI_34171 [Reticulomyxa filosa]|uniref:Uncharacterized protein n=1 Tax=Reticulomyxa filosa TaxID=46433 RepID=X6LNP1_RETFI|nr:hypothetical protein RFI_34171 [Reticulomyxa filosa]|eukprot:ETO03239.1 hypothetical protein RFI_34171 [Reticulomyxa filosa]
MTKQLLSRLDDDDQTRLMNQLLEDARKLELRHLGVQYLETDEFIDEEKHFTGFKQGLLDNEKCVRHILSCYLNNRNASNEKYPLFVRDLLAVIKRVEGIRKHTERQKTYTAQLLYLYEQNKENAILQVQILRDMCIHQCVDNNTLLLYSKDAVLLNRCLEKMLLEANIDNVAITNWTLWCHEHNYDKLELIIRISRLKKDLIKLIVSLININIKVPKLAQDTDVHNLIKRMAVLLSSRLDFENSSYERMLHVWFLKQLYMWKGIHWIELIFTHPVIRQEVPLFGGTNPTNIFAALTPRPFHCDFYNPLVGVYGPRFIDNIHTILTNERYHPNLNLSCQILIDCLSLVNLYGFTYKEAQLRNLRAVIHAQDASGLLKQTAFKQIFNHLTSTVKSRFHWESMEDTLDPIVARLCFHFLCMQQYLKHNPFRLLFADSGSFLSPDISSPAPAKEPVPYYCWNGHPLLLEDASLFVYSEVICGIDGCGAKVCTPSISKTSAFPPELPSKVETKPPRSKSIWYMLRRYYTSPKRMEPTTIKLTTWLLLRLVNHLALLLRDECIPEDRDKLQQLVQHKSEESVSNMLWWQVKNDWKQLEGLTGLNEELLEMGLHSWLKDFSDNFEKWYPNGLIATSMEEVYKFEERLDKEYDTFFNSKDRFISLRNNGRDVAKRPMLTAFSELMAEIEETKALTDLYQMSCMPQLFLVVQSLTWKDLSCAFSHNPRLCDQYPLTAQLLSWNEGIWTLQYLPSIAKLVKHVHDEYSRQKLPEQLRSVRITDVVKQRYECNLWWNELVLCWNSFAVYCQRLKANDLSKSIEHVAVIDTKAVTAQFSIYTIIRLLQDEQNLFLKTLRRLRRLSTHEDGKNDGDENEGERKSQHHCNDNNRATYKFMFDITPNDVLCFDKKKLNAIIQRHSVPVLEYGAINDSHYYKHKYFDLASIENEIYQHFVHGRQPLALGVPLFQYRHDLDIHNSITTIETQHHDIQTAQIETLWEHTRLYTVSSLQKQKALEVLNDAIVFLSDNPDQFRSDMPLTDLLQNMHFEKKDWGLFELQTHFNDAADVLCVKHIASLWRFLNNLVRIERLDESSIAPFVLEMYRRPLSNELQKQVKDFVKKTSLTIMKEVLRVWREIAYKLGQVQRDSSNIQEFQLVFLLRTHFSDNDLRYFPHQSLTWRFCAAAYHCAYQEWRKKDEQPTSSWIQLLLSKFPFF